MQAKFIFDEAEPKIERDAIILGGKVYDHNEQVEPWMH